MLKYRGRKAPSRRVRRGLKATAGVKPARPASRAAPAPAAPRQRAHRGRSGRPAAGCAREKAALARPWPQSRLSGRRPHRTPPVCARLTRRPAAGNLFAIRNLAVRGESAKSGWDARRKPQTGPCGPARICNAADRPSPRFSHPRTGCEQVPQGSAIFFEPL